MKNFLSILILLTIFSCSKDDNAEQGEVVNNGKRLIRSINDDDNNYVFEYSYDSNGNVTSILNENKKLFSEYTYNSENIREFTKLYQYENDILARQRLIYYSYDEQDRLVVQKREDFDYETMLLTDIGVDSISYYGNKIISKRYEGEFLNIDGQYSMKEVYVTEYSLNEEGELVSLMSTENSYGVTFTSSLSFFYEEKLRSIRIIGQYIDFDLSSNDIEATIESTDYLQKGNNIRNVFKNNFLRSQSGPDYTHRFILNFSGSSSDYYLKSIKINNIKNDTDLSVYEYIYDYKFDAEGYPISLNYSNSDTQQVLNTIYEWE